MGKPCLDRKGDPIYVTLGSDKYKEGYAKINWNKRSDKNERSSKNTDDNTNNTSN